MDVGKSTLPQGCTYISRCYPMHIGSRAGLSRVIIRRPGVKRASINNHSAGLMVHQPVSRDLSVLSASMYVDT